MAFEMISDNAVMPREAEQMNGQAQAHNLDPEVAAERTKAFRKARRHTWFVRTLKTILPLGVVGLIAGYGVILSARQIVPVRKGDSFDIGTPTLDRGKPAMKNPKYQGFNSDGSKFFVTAKQATPDFKQPDRVTLKTISGTLTQIDKVKTQFTAAGGVFDNKKGVLDLFERIDIVSESGLKAQLNNAKIYVKSSKIVTSLPVAAQLPSGTIRANAMTLQIKKRRATFSNGVAVRLKPKPKAKPASGSTGQNGNNKSKTTSKGLIGSSDAPIDVIALTLHVDDLAHTAVFKDSVRATQAGSTMRAEELNIIYEGGNTSGAQKQTNPLGANGAAAGPTLKQIKAIGKVVMVSANGQRARSQQAEFNVQTKTSILVGNVVLTQGLNVLTGDHLLLDQARDTVLLTGQVMLRQGKNTLQGGRLFVNRNSATSSLTSPQRGGRVYATFYQTAPKGRKRKTPKANAGFGAASFKTDPNAPIKIIANRLDINDKVKSATFKGKVIAKQGGMSIRARTLIATYSGQSGLGLGSTALNSSSTKPANKAQATQLKRIEARKNVVVKSDTGQTATGDWADFDVKNNKIIMGGNVELKQGSTVILGEKIVINMLTGSTKIVPRRGGSKGSKMSLGGNLKCTRACLKIIPGEAMQQFKRAKQKNGSTSWNTSTSRKGKKPKLPKSNATSAWKVDQQR